MYYKVRLLDNSQDNTVAEVIGFQKDQGISISVSCSNPKVKLHLERILMTEYYTLAPGKVTERESTDFAAQVLPNTMEFFQLVPEILSWRGYFAEYCNEVHKSLDWLDTSMTFKSEGIHYNAKGDRIVEKVPEGYIAVNKQGEVVPAGGRLNANIDKDDAEWRLVENPHEKDTPENRVAGLRNAMTGGGEYHPGLVNTIYSDDYKENSHEKRFAIPARFRDKHVGVGSTIKEFFEGISQAEAAKNTKAETPTVKGKFEIPKNLPSKGPEGKILYSPQLGVAMDGKFFPPPDMDVSKGQWFLFEYPSDYKSMGEDKEKLHKKLDYYSRKFGQMPQYIKGVDDGVVEAPRDLDTTQGYRYSLPTVRTIDSVGDATANHIVVNNLPEEEFIISDVDSPEYQSRVEFVRHKMDKIKGLVSKIGPDGKRTVSPELETMDIPELTHGGEKFLGQLKTYQKAGVLALTDMSQYEVGGGPRGVHGHFLNWVMGSGKALPNTEPVLTPYGFVEMGELKVKDEVIGSSGSAIKVLGVFPQGVRDIYRVYFNDGTYVDCDNEHLWAVYSFEDRAKLSNRRQKDKAKEERAQRSGKINPATGRRLRGNYKIAEVDEIKRRVITTREIMESLTVTNTQGDKLNYSIPSYRPELFDSMVDVEILSQLIVKYGEVKGASVELTRKNFDEVQQSFILPLLEMIRSFGIHCSERRGKYVVKFPDRAPFSELDSLSSVNLIEEYNFDKFITAVEFQRQEEATCILVDSEDHLFVTRDYNLTHNTAVSLAAEAVLRNRGDLETGTQCTLIAVQPSQTYVWRDEIEKFRGRYGVVIDGIQPGKSTPSKEYRMQQWEELLESARDGTMPQFVLVGASKFSKGRNENDEVTDSIDAQYMKLLAMGGTSSGAPVQGGHIGLMITDETGLYVNTSSNRSKVFSSVLDHLYHSNGLVWTMNGDISANSATDTIMEVSFINKYIRDNVPAVDSHYTMPDPLRPNSNTRLWARKVSVTSREQEKKAEEGRFKFMRRFGTQIFNLDGRTIAGDEYGLVRQPDLISPLGATWGRVYMQALDKAANLNSAHQSGRDTRILGLLNIMINSSYGSVTAPRLIEYGLAKNEVDKAMQERLDPKDFYRYKQQISEFKAEATEIKHGEDVPRASLNVAARDKMYQEKVEPLFRDLLDSILEGWDNPSLDTMHSDIMSKVKAVRAGKPMKIGVAGFSKRVMENLYRRINTDLAGTSSKVMLFTGDNSPKEIAELQRAQQTAKSAVVSLVTTPRGLSLPSDVAYRLASWNPAVGGQYEHRFFRDQKQHCISTTAAPSGICQYMRDVERSKKKIADEAIDALIDIDIEDENSFEEGSKKMDRDGVTKLLDKLRSARYLPKLQAVEGQ